MEEEKKRYKNRKKLEVWHYKQKTGPSAAEHRKKENEHSKKYYRQKKGIKEEEGEALPGDNDNSGVVVDKKEKVRAQNRVR